MPNRNHCPCVRCIPKRADQNVRENKKNAAVRAPPLPRAPDDAPDDSLFLRAQQALADAALDQQNLMPSRGSTEQPPLEKNQAEQLDLSPKAVAEYLFLTADFEGFNTAMEDLKKSSVIDPDVALQYKNAVGLQYQQLMKDIMKVKQELFKELMEATESRDDEPKTSDVNAKHGQVAAEDPFAANRLLTFGKNNALNPSVDRPATLDELLEPAEEENPQPDQNNDL